MESQMERNYHNKVLRSMRNEINKLLSHGRSEPLESYGTDMASEMTQIDRDTFVYAKEIMRWIVIFAIIFMTGFISGKAHAFSYSDEQIVNAIYKAEGGSHAQYKYGIRSVKCSSTDECRKICLRTIRHNRERYQRYGRFQYKTYIAFLASRFCPTSGNLSANETKLNQYWLKNVTFFLNKEMA